MSGKKTVANSRRLATLYNPGLAANWKQFSLLVILNAFVGAMIGLERSILPAYAGERFHLFSTSVILSFIIIFGISKAIANYFSGYLASRFSRKSILIAGWILALPVPLIFLYTNSWNGVILANILLGIHQGFTWSTNVVMKIDLAGPKNRGLAMGLNEFSGYIAVAAMAYLTSWIADTYGVFPYPFYLGIAISVAGLLITLFFIKDTGRHVEAEAASGADLQKQFANIFSATSFTHRQLSSVTQAGLVNNLNDGMIWGLLPILLAQRHFSLTEIGILTATYPAVWGLAQVLTGKLADIFSKKGLLFWGMFLQAMAIFALPYATQFWELFSVCILIGLGTAMVYPTFLAAISIYTHPYDRAKSLGVFRFWRDSGYAIGAVLTGYFADLWGLENSIFLTAIITLLSSLVIFFRMK